MTIQNLGGKTAALQLHTPAVVSATAAGNVATTDLLSYEGDVVFTLAHAAAGSGVTLTAKMQHSNTTTAGDFEDVTGGGFTAAAANTAGFTSVTLNSDVLRRYVRVYFTVSGGTGTGAASVTAAASAKYL
ncbi:MAG: hypothetical protein ACO242_02240 [Candidatus Fonsibacter ubiquis]